MDKKILRGSIFGVILALILVSGFAFAQSDIKDGKSDFGSQSAALASPPLSDFIDIKIDDRQNNNASVAYNSKHNEFLVVWEEEVHGGEYAIFGRRVGSTGSTIGPAFPIQHFTNRILLRPDVAYSEKQDEYLVVFYERINANNYDIAVVPVSWDGVPGSGYFIDYDADWDWYPVVAYNSQNDEYLVVWENCISCLGGNLRDINAQRIRASDGMLLSWRNIASSPNIIRRLPDVAYNPARNEYLIAYTRHSSASTDGDIIGVRTDYNMSWPALTEFLITPSGLPPQDGVTLAAGPDEYLAVWTEEHGTKTSIWGRRVQGDGTLHSFFSLANDPGKHRVEPAVAFGDGGRYQVAWREIAGSWDLHGRDVRAGQNSPDGPEYPIDIFPNNQRVPAVACAPVGPCLIAYEDDFPGADYEIRGRLSGYQRVVLPLTLRNH